jgi:hypothetical protein
MHETSYWVYIEKKQNSIAPTDKNTKYVLIGSWCKIPAVKFIFPQVKSIVLSLFVPLRHITSTIDGGAGLHASPRFSPRKLPRYPLNRSLVGPRASLDLLEKRNICCHQRDLNNGPSRRYLSRCLHYPGLFSYSAGYENIPSPIESQDSVPCSQESIKCGSRLDKIFSSNRALISPSVPTRANGPLSSDFPH